MAKAIWVTYAVLQASSGGKEWRVDRNEAGDLRCNCPSYIFCKVQPRSCKHCRRCIQQMQEEVGVPVGVPGAVAVPVARPVTPPATAAATKMFHEMCEAAQKAARVNVGNALGHTATNAMIEILALRLAIYVAPAMPAAVTSIGVRRITFDD